MNDNVAPFCDACYWAMSGKALMEDKPGTDLRSFMGFLYPPTAATNAIGSELFLQYHVAAGELLGTIHVSEKTPFTLRWANLGALPKKITIRLEGTGDEPKTFVLDGQGNLGGVCTASHLAFPAGLPAATDAKTGKKVRKTYVFRVALDDKAFDIVIGGAITVDP